MVDSNKSDRVIDTRAHQLAEKGDTQALEALLRKEPKLLDAEDEYGFYPVHYAARSNQEKSLETIIEMSPLGLKEVEKPRPPSKNMDAIFMAVESNAVNVVDHLLNRYSESGVNSSEFLKAFGNSGLEQLKDNTSYGDVKVCRDFVQLFNYLSNVSSSSTEKKHFNQLLAKMKEVAAPERLGSSIELESKLKKMVADEVQMIDTSQGVFAKFMGKAPAYSEEYRNDLNVG